MSVLDLGPICAFGSSITWAIGTTGYSKLSRNHSPFAVNFSRAMVALPLFFLGAWATLGSLTGMARGFGMVQSSNVLWFGLSMIASYGLGDSIFMLSTRYLGIPGALAIASIYPLWTAVVGAMAQGESLAIHQCVGLLLTIAGVVAVILSGGKSSGNGPAPSVWKGLALALLTSGFWALNSVAIARGGVGLNPMISNLIRMSLGLSFSFFFGRVLSASQPFVLSFESFKPFWWIFVIETFGGSYFFLYGLTHSPLAIAATLSSLAPVLSVPVAWAMGIEKFSLSRTVGVCTVVVGVTLLIYS